MANQGWRVFTDPATDEYVFQRQDAVEVRLPGGIPAPGDFIAKAFLDAKGDLISASADDTPVILTVGADGEFLVADSGETSGLRWDTLPAAPPQCVTYSKAGTLTTGTGTFRWYAKGAWTIIDVRASVGTQPTGAAVIVDVHLNGTTIFTTQSNRPEIAVSTNTDVSGAPDVTALADGDFLTVDIDQIGSTIAGADLTVQVWLQP